MGKLQGLNIQQPWSQLILSGKKKVETREYPLPKKFYGKELWLIETPGTSGKFKSRIIGKVLFVDCCEYKTKDDWEREKALHLVETDDSNYGFREGKKKFGWVVGAVEAVDPFLAPSPRGIIYSGEIETPR
jgi:hypothetical protein